jgi:hypothetical protein
MTSAVIITPSAMKPAALQFATAMGWQDEGGDSFGIELQTEGVTTHYGCRADVFDSFKALMADPPEEALPLLAALIIDLSDSLWGREHWDSVLAAHGLTQRPDDPL